MLDERGQLLRAAVGFGVGARQRPGERGAAGLGGHRPYAAGRQQFPDLNDRVLRRTPAGRWGVIDDFAGVTVFLASGSDFITGPVITVDGGYSVQG